MDIEQRAREIAEREWAQDGLEVNWDGLSAYLKECYLEKARWVQEGIRIGREQAAVIAHSAGHEGLAVEIRSAKP